MMAVPAAFCRGPQSGADQPVNALRHGFARERERNPPVTFAEMNISYESISF